ncbi:glycosyltransferase family 2 protein [Winogradskyella alexanderae]|uniref:Glycosyltransferase n=1 Tax=Winogradskyella alexanderae TaxID=2877123 RepID=A0ABS7XSF8_9FLAO|nr:glycosyltransferase family 2 protein [Winogradskyella alexanderae]MCA0131976.1 glycosyltransferase [Winogradskyella alexanderae]
MSCDLLSIITINYNNALGLKKTMESLGSQSSRDFEHIIIDGNSTDDSLNVIKSFNYKNLNFVSERDSGIYNAMNKGIKMAKGKYILFLNSGDYLENKKVISHVLPYLKNDYGVLSGSLIFDEDSGPRLREHPEKMTFSYLVGNAISHPSTFIKRELFSKYGLYDESLKIVSDWAFFIKVLGLNNESFAKIPLTISVFDTKGVSSNENNYDYVYKERRKVLETYFPLIFNNENDTYIFEKFLKTNKRFRYLKIVDKSPFFRKIATVHLGVSAKLLRLFGVR